MVAERLKNTAKSINFLIFVKYLLQTIQKYATKCSIITTLQLHNVGGQKMYVFKTQSQFIKLKQYLV